MDALQEELDRRLVAVGAGLEVFKRTAKSFDMSGIEDGCSEAASFKLAQGRHAYFTNALIDDLSSVEEQVKAMRRALEYNDGRPQPSFEKEVTEAERDLEQTDANIRRLSEVCQQLIDIAGDTSPERAEDHASLKLLIEHANGRKDELDHTLSEMDKSLDDVIAQAEAGTFTDIELAKKASSYMKAGAALSLAEGEWIDFLQKAMRAPSLDPFRAELPRKKEWLEECRKIYEDARAALRALTVDE
ncbi:hypothetical protein [Mesorhizobium sp. KR9-304]|uniref:hypothetical protein n=1 Tax=Mesorhizobium sp. KR9-304 TaxID=3156614 RepID=UPI0032B5C43F